MFKAIGRIGRDKASFKVTFEPLSVDIAASRPTSAFLVFQRGDAKAEQTKFLQVKKSGSEFNSY